MFKGVDDFWQFERTVHRESRYVFSDETKAFLDAIVETSKRRLKKFPQNGIAWRAQLGGSTSEDQNGMEVPDAYPSARMSPLPNCAIEGRINPKGIPCLYLAFEKETAMAEMRPWVEAEISLAQFVVLKDCQIVDCSLDTANRELWMFGEREPSADESEKVVWGDVARAFSRPVTPVETIADYAPTQIIAEAFRHQGYDGVAYRSSLGKGKNLALFDLKAAELINCTLYAVKSMSYEFEQTWNTYHIPKHYREAAQRAGIDSNSPDAQMKNTIVWPTESEAEQ